MIRYVLVITAIFCFTFSCKKHKELQDQAVVHRLPYFVSSDFTPQWFSESDLVNQHKIPAFSFINQAGDTITNETYTDKIYIADFFFTICPGICPQLTKNMNYLQKTYQNDHDIKLLSHTVMPWHDSVPVLKDYAKRNAIDQTKWNLVTGDKNEIYKIAREGYFADEDFAKTQDENNFIHTENFILVDKKGYIRGVYNGTIALDVKRLIRHIEILKKE